MIIKNQSNIKVHFAGTESLSQLPAAHAAGVEYALFSVFKLIAHTAEITSVNVTYNKTSAEVPLLISENTRHSIMDSGLFTLMFGSHKGQKDEKFLSKWQDSLVEFVNKSKYPGTCVEVDCQKVLSPEHAWKFRERLRKRLPNNRIMNVFHLEDGHKGLDRLIEFSDYIAISIPELRILKKKEFCLRLASYIKNKKPEIDIHLLGCTEKSMLRDINFCTSSDSTSWISSVRYGFIETSMGDFHIKRFQNSTLFDTYLEKVKKSLAHLGIDGGNLNRSAALTFAAEQLLLRYSKYAGSQC